ncbi:glycosyltransferase family 2 protein [Oscillatoria acuminata]|uniref:Glycosyl transferase n=1 Tax=Oscillatoria acuminata PCC 6304 TaxID=56110 RepID=K9TCA9_9CYAN|nr:glycosyltransferase family 2 protein [Oscillatoria acuminata]AFY80058.1 glycosyl transferase [Oscillatoria acuminata PCC 6304]
MNPTFLSFCTIVKNEKYNLSRCLTSVKPYVNEIIVVDTGSDDGTPDIALEQGAKVFYFQWCDDFSAARNYAVSQASGEWILTLDADEELIIQSENFREILAANSKVLVYSLDLINVGQEENQIGGKLQRIFRNIPEIRYQGRLHEQLIYENQKISGSRRVYLNSLKILHYGYSDPDLTAQKATKRNIPLLERMKKEEGLSLGNLFSLAQMCDYFGQTEKAQVYYEELFGVLLHYVMNNERPNELVWLATMLHFFADKCLKQEQYETAQIFCQFGLKWFSDFPPLNALAGDLLIALGFTLGAVPYFEKCLQLGQEGNYYARDPFDVSFINTYPAYRLGCAYLNLHRWQEAKIACEMALSFDGNYSPAQQLLEQILQFFPDKK